MTPHEHMTKHVRNAPGGGIAWERRVFKGSDALASQELVDAAVDIAWERLMPDTLERPDLEIEKNGKMIVFRVPIYSFDQMKAA